MSCFGRVNNPIIDISIDSLYNNEITYKESIEMWYDGPIVECLPKHKTALFFTCLKKVYFRKAGRAFKVLADMQAADPEGTKNLCVFSCPRCEGFHLGTATTPKQIIAKEAAEALWKAQEENKIALLDRQTDFEITGWKSPYVPDWEFQVDMIEKFYKRQEVSDQLRQEKSIKFNMKLKSTQEAYNEDSYMLHQWESDGGK